MNVLFVCHGNVNRSAAAEIIAKQKYPFLNVKSCGLRARPGTITSKKMRDVLNAAGYPTNGIRSTSITQELVTWADIVFYMDNPNAVKLVEEFGILKKFQLLPFFIGFKKIPDPGFAKGTIVHKDVLFLIETSLKKWVSMRKDFEACLKE